MSALVVVTLTGFSSGRGHGHGHHSSSGGGCSSSSQDHDTSSSTSGGSDDVHKDDTDDYYGASGSGTTSGTGGYRDSYDDDTHDGTTGGGSTTSEPSTAPDGEVTLLSCATKKKPYATVEVSNPGDTDGGFLVGVTFADSQDITITSKTEEVDVPAGGKVRARIEIGGSGLAAEVDHCDEDPIATRRD